MTTALLLGCLKVFFCRILDVTLGSIRTVLMVREKSKFAAMIGFLEVFVWYIVVRDALNFDGPVLPVAFSYAAGYAMGTFIGSTIAKKLVSGHVTVHVVTSGRNKEKEAVLRKAGYGITVLNVEESEYGGQRHLILADLDKKQLESFTALIKHLDPNAFVLVQETKSYIGGFRRPGK